MRGFFRELKQRRVYRVAIAYGVIASALVQLGGTVLPVFHAAEWVQQLFLVLIALGFPFSLVLAWAFDITGSGIQRTESAVSLRPTHRRQILVLAAAGTAMAALALAAYWFWHPWKTNPSRLASPSVPEKSIAVLPFENLSTEKENAFFTDGVQDQILTDLAKVADLKVIGHTSVQQYKSDLERDLHKIGEQLGVAYLLQGSVQRSGKNLRVSAQLSDARTGRVLWAETYDRELSDVFALQSEIAQKIVSQLQVTISPEERARIEERPTRDMAAFDLYLQAKELVEGYLNAQDPRQSFLKAIQFLEDATRRDPDFVLAYAYAARAHGLLYFLDLDPTPARVASAFAAAERALRLDRRSAEAHLSMADFYFHCRRDYDRADEELALAKPGLPNSTAFLTLSGYIDRRQGRWESAERNFRRAVELDPRSINAVNLLVDTYVLLRQFDKAVAGYDRAIAAGLDIPIIHLRRELIRFAQTGEVSILRQALEKTPATLDVGGGETPVRIMLAIIDRNYERAARELAASPRDTFQEVDFSFYYPRAWYEAMIARAGGDAARAHERFAVARQVLEQRLTIKPNDARTLAVLAQVDAGLGEKERAVTEGRQAVDLMPFSRDAYDNPLVRQGLAQVYTWTGEAQQALTVLEELMKQPGYLTYGYLRVDPAWDPLRGDARFNQFVESLKPKP
jgi:serine/threonine-protein kinase